MKPILSTLLALAGLVLNHFLPPESTQQPTPQAMAKTPKLTPCLWFPKEAEEAMRFYLATFPDARVLSESRWGEGGPFPKGSLMTARFLLAGQEFMVLNGCPGEFSESVSLSVDCETQEEVDRYWAALTKDGGEPGRCGWLKDRYGVSWQVVPSVLGELLGDKDPARAGRVGAALMQMEKLDIRRLQEAAAGR